VETEKGKRDRAILSVLLYHGLRREELCTLKVRDIHGRCGVLHQRVHGKGGKVRLPAPAPRNGGARHRLPRGRVAWRRAGGALFWPVKNNTGGTVAGAITADGIYKMVKHYAKRVGVEHQGLWGALPAGYGGHQRAGPRGRHRQGAGVARARQHRHHAALRPEDSPTFKVRY
jgi:integrase